MLDKKELSISTKTPKVSINYRIVHLLVLHKFLAFGTVFLAG
jgi:hypothetical protein